jgi:two-component system, NarL family, response regulator DevR
MVDPASPVTNVKPIRLFILDDHELVRRGLTDLLTATDDLIIVGEAATAGDALRRITAAAPDVALLDARLPDGSGIDVCREIRSSQENIRCLILTSYDDDEALFAAVMAGPRDICSSRSVATAWWRASGRWQLGGRCWIRR